jgi:hypothetical protein
VGVTNGALDNELNDLFPTTPNIWYLGLIANVPTPVLSPTDTLSDHPGWVEAAAGVVYSGNRPLWTNGTSNNQQVTNASPISFALLEPAAIYGIFLCSVATGTSGSLFGTAPLIGGPQSGVNGDTLTVTLTATGASS